MPIVTVHCRMIDGLGNIIKEPQAFLKIDGKMYRTHIHLTGVHRCEGGWTGSIIHYRAGFKNPRDKEDLRQLAKMWLEQDQSPYALDPTGLTHCGIRFVF